MSDRNLLDRMTFFVLQANRPDAEQHADRDHGSRWLPGKSERSSVRRTRPVQDIVAVLPARKLTYRPHLAPGHHFDAAVRTSPGRGQL